MGRTSTFRAGACSRPCFGSNCGCRDLGGLLLLGKRPHRSESHRIDLVQRQQLGHERQRIEAETVGLARVEAVHGAVELLLHRRVRGEHASERVRLTDRRDKVCVDCTASSNAIASPFMRYMTFKVEIVPTR